MSHCQNDWRVEDHFIQYCMSFFSEIETVQSNMLLPKSTNDTKQENDMAPQKKR
jgi:hypothetical protein